MPVQGTIRDQVKRSKANGKTAEKDAASAPADGRERMDKEVVKAVLASPLVTPWPNIPAHLQKSVMAALPKLAPKDIAEYHLGRARCHQKEKKHRKQALRPKENAKPDEASSKLIEIGSLEGSTGAADLEQKGLPVRPTSPAILEHLVLGINETIKTLERNIDDLKLRLMLMADAINATNTILPADRDGLLPTAPRSPSPPTLKDPSPLGWIIVPVLSISPQSLVSPIPQYCATYNSLVYQWTQLQKTVKSRLKEERWDVLGDERREIRVIPLGKVEPEMALAVGLRRLACLGVRISHPEIDVLEKLLPKSVLHPPRHNITLPFPSSSLSIHTSSKRKAQSEDTEKSAKKAKIAPSTLPLPHVHYAPLTVKGITTTLPKDGNARKQKRMEGVRQKRLEAKERRRKERKEAFNKGLKGDRAKVPRHGEKKSKKTRKAKQADQPS